MKLSAPIYRLKRKAKILSREESIALHEALDRVAAEEGYKSWGLLAAKAAETAPALRLYSQLHPGDLVLIGARPGQGKTLLALELAVEAMKAGRRSNFFTLEYTDNECRERFQAIGVDIDGYGSQFGLDCSDHISSSHIVRRLADEPTGSLVVIDYLQLLDQKRDNPELNAQVCELKAFARERGLLMVFISQIDRSYDPSSKPLPDLGDVRLPNPLDLKLFDKTCFLNNGEVRFRAG